MSDGSKEKTVEKSTDELLSETDEILGDVGGGDDSGARESSGASSAEETSDLDTGSASADRTASAAVDDRGFRKYFEPKSAGISGVLLLAGALLGGVVPLVGAFTQLLGVGGATFLHGLGANDSRYGETFVASAVVGGLVAVVTNLRLLAIGSAVPYLAVTTALMVVVALVGHYFGRDLRAGLAQNVGGGGGGQDDDVPGW
jgi:hypothetical protein